jgi:hypothetical protein
LDALNRLSLDPVRRDGKKARVSSQRRVAATRRGR